MIARTHISTLLPSFVIIIFWILFYYSASIYPGGNELDSSAPGFSWVHNYWCHLMDTMSVSGFPNPSRRVSIGAFVLLCGGLLYFFFLFADHYVEGSRWKQMTKVFGTLSMIAAALISSPLHDYMIIVSSLFGLVVSVIILYTIFNSSMSLYKWSGIVCVLALILCNISYYSGVGKYWLPLFQKFSMTLVLFWIMGLNISMVKKVHP